MTKTFSLDSFLNDTTGSFSIGLEFDLDDAELTTAITNPKKTSVFSTIFSGYFFLRANSRYPLRLKGYQNADKNSDMYGRHHLPLLYLNHLLTYLNELTKTNPKAPTIFENAQDLFMLFQTGSPDIERFHQIYRLPRKGVAVNTAILSSTDNTTTILWLDPITQQIE